MLKKGLAEIKEEVKNQHPVVYQTKHYSFFGDKFGAEHFKLVVNTVMKWVIIPSKDFVSMIPCKSVRLDKNLQPARIKEHIIVGEV